MLLNKHLGNQQPHENVYRLETVETGQEILTYR